MLIAKNKILSLAVVANQTIENDPYDFKNSTKKYAEQKYETNIYGMHNVDKKYLKVLSYISGVQRTLNTVGIPFCEETFNFSGGFATLLNRLFVNNFDIPHEKISMYFTDIDIYIPKSTFELLLNSSLPVTVNKNCVIDFNAKIEYYDPILERNVIDSRKIQLINMFDKSMNQICDSFDLSICKNWFNIVPPSQSLIKGPYSWQDNLIQLHSDVRNLPDKLNFPPILYIDSFNNIGHTKNRASKYRSRYNIKYTIDYKEDTIAVPDNISYTFPNISYTFPNIDLSGQPKIVVSDVYTPPLTQSINIDFNINDGEHCDSCSEKHKLKWIDLTYICPVCKKQFG